MLVNVAAVCTYVEQDYHISMHNKTPWVIYFLLVRGKLYLVDLRLDPTVFSALK